jgi:hypothetical protein
VIRVLRDKRLKDSLMQGYMAMADENLLTAEDRISCGAETLDD